MRVLGSPALILNNRHDPRAWSIAIRTFFPLALTLALTVAATPALAHLNEQHRSLASALSHSLLGLEHVLGIVALGLWGAVLGDAARWALPTAFVGAMVTGFLLLGLNVEMPLAHAAHLASVTVLGLLVALIVCLPVRAAVAVAGLFGLCHGHEHAIGLDVAVTWGMASGFLVSAAVLHAAGLVIAFGFAQGLHHIWLVRGIGGATALGGLWIASAG